MLQPMANMEGSTNLDPVTLARLRREFLADTLSSLEDVYAAARILSKGEDADLMARLERWAHNLRGSSGTYGYPELSDFGEELETLLSKAKSFPGAETLKILDGVSRFLSLSRDKGVCIIKGKNEPPPRKPDPKIHALDLLMVDDDPILRKIAKVALEQSGSFNVRTLPSGELAVETAASEKPDLIILDVVMPGEDGFEVCRRLKADDRTKAIPIVFLSSDDRGRDISEAKEAGAIGLIPKPFKPKSLSGQIRELLEANA